MTRHRVLVAALLALAGTVRLVFVLHLPELPLYWDEVHYNAWAQAYMRAFAAVGDPAVCLAALRAAFVGSIQKGELYSAFVGLIYAVRGAQPRAVFFVQAALDVASCLFVYGIARRLGGRAVGLLALALAATYPPFVFAAARLQSETLCSFLYLGGLWALLAPALRWRRATRGLAGFLLALAMLTRPACEFLFPLLLPLLVLVERATSRRGRLVSGLAFSVGFFVLIGPRLLLTDQLFGHPLWSGDLDPSMYVYAGAVLRNQGWETDHLTFIDPPQGELAVVVHARGGRRPNAGDYRRATLLTWGRHPLGSSRVVLHKLYQAWRDPYNDSRRRLLIGTSGTRWYHQLVLALGAVGMVLALHAWTVGLPVLAVTAYLWVAYLAMKIEVRYVVSVMPLMVCFAALALVALGEGLATQRRAAGRRRAVFLAAAALAVAGALQVCSLGRLVALPLGLSAAAAHDARIGGQLVLTALGAAIVWTLLRARWGAAWAWAAALGPFVLGALIFSVGRPVADIWHQWACPLRPHGEVARRRLIFPAALSVPRQAFLRFDLAATGGGDDLVVRVNGREVRRFVGGPQPEDAAPVEDYYHQIFAGQGQPQRPWHAWYQVALPPELVAPGKRLDVELTVSGEAHGDGVVWVFGDYPAGDPRRYDGPSVLSPGLPADTSIYKYLDDGDFRMRRRIALRGTSRSSFFDGGRWSDADLSPAPGRQYGRYRIFLLLVYADGHVLVF